MRRFILTVEILFLSLVLLGGSSVPLRNDTAVATKFRWEDHRTIAHALGGLAGKDYLNSREGFLAMYEQGELDYVDVPTDLIPNYPDAEFYYSGACDFIKLNTGDGPLANRNFRLALNYG